MNFTEWMEEEQNRLMEFAKWWMEQHKIDPIEFPLDLEEEDWDEQFNLWVAVEQ